MKSDEPVVRASSLVGAAEDGGSDDDGAGERRKFTQRMPEQLVADIDEFAERHGMSRNAAINMLAKAGLEEF